MKKKLENIPYLQYNINSKTKAKALRHNPTNAEKKLWTEVLSNNRLLNNRFLRQKPILDYIVDFYCSKLLIVIEVDGEIHDSKDNIEYDNIRSDILESIGLKVIRIRNDEILYNIDNVKSRLLHFVKTREQELNK